jgi:DNA-binding MarR family transcriptional regulator
MHTTTDQDRAALSRVHAALLPIIKLSVAHMAGITPSAASRLLQDLSSTNKFGGVGLSLIDQRVDDFDQRYMRSYLSEWGRALVQKIVGEMDRDCRNLGEAA